MNEFACEWMGGGSAVRFGVLLRAPFGVRQPRSGALTGLMGRLPVEQTDFARLIRSIAQRQDRQAFATLFDHFAPRIKAYLGRFGTIAGNAEDLAQETMLMVWRKAPQFDPARASASAWIFAIARNQRIDALRRRRSDGLQPDRSAEPDAPPQPDFEMNASERDHRVREALLDLPPEQARLVELSFFDERPHADIATSLGLPLGTVKSRIRLAMIRLREKLDDVL